MHLRAEHISKTFVSTAGVLFGAKKEVHAVRDLSVEVERGQSLGIVGESGSGKTTFAKILAGFLSPDGGSAHLGERDLLASHGRARAALVQMVFQDPFASLNPKLLLGTQMAEALASRGKNSINERAAALMSDVGLPADFLQRYPHQVSGGQRQRFAIARALAAEPELLVADEPVSSLDVSVQSQIVALINALRERKKFTQIVISHDLAVIANTCERLIVMKDGDVVEQGATESVLAQPSHAYTRRLLDAAPVL